jgi:hypothetical protein
MPTFLKTIFKNGVQINDKIVPDSVVVFLDQKARGLVLMQP